VIAALDREAPPASLRDPQALMAACPAGCAPLAARPGETIWDHPAIAAAPVAAEEPPSSLARAIARRFGRAS
jgi:hypothetical protein